MEEPIATAPFSLRVTIRGDLARSGRIALSELARLAGELQASLERVAVSLATPGEAQRLGRRRADLVEAVRLDLVSLKPGSAVLELSPHSEEQLELFDNESALDAAFHVLASGIGQLLDDPYSSPPEFNHAIITGLVDLTGSIGDGVSEVRIDRPGLPTLVLDGGVRQASRLARRRYVDEVRRVVGRLEMGDFAPSALRCRVDAVDGSFMCDFEPSLREAVLAAMDQIVEAEGAAETAPEAGRVRILHLERLRVIAEQRRTSLDDLIREQTVTPIDARETLVGDRIDDFDDFLAAVLSLRKTA